MLICVLFLSVFYLGSVSGESPLPIEDHEFTLDNIKTMEDLEKNMLDIFNNSINYCREEINVLRNFVNHVKAEHEKVTDSPEEFLANPINAYSLIKRMTRDWSDLKSALEELEGIVYLKKEMKTLRTVFQVPNAKDLNVAAREILKLQLNNDFQVSDLAQGIINGKDYGDSLNWDDCFELGKVAYENMELNAAKDWFLNTLIKMKTIDPPIDEAIANDIELHVTEYLALIDYELGENESALEKIDSILAKYPEHHVKNTKTYILLNETPDFFEENHL